MPTLLFLLWSTEQLTVLGDAVVSDGSEKLDIIIVGFMGWSGSQTDVLSDVGVIVIVMPHFH